MTNLASFQIRQIAGLYVDKELLHLLAVVELARWCTRTVGSVRQDLQIALQTLGSFLLTLLLICGLLEADFREGVAGIMHVAPSASRPRSGSDRLVTFVAQVVVGTNIAVESIAMSNIAVACTALLQEFGGHWIVKLE